MTDKFTPITAELHEYAVTHSDADEISRRLAAETERAAGELVVMMTAPEQAALMGILVEAIGARRALELGTFTGFGSLAIARGLGPDGVLVTCDISEEWTAIGRRYWEEAGVAEKIDLRLGPALETLASLPAGEPFDFAFIDADKESYPAYYEECLRLLRPGGLLLVDNVFSAGAAVAAEVPEARRASVAAIRELNDRMAADPRVRTTMIGVADGIAVAVKLGDDAERDERP